MSRILYKYLDINGGKSMIGNKKLQFTNASQLNDPFDCHPKLIDYSNVAMPESSDYFREWKVKIEENDALNRRNETWLCSLSKDYASLLMWSHYCRNHSGICIGVDIDKVMDCVPPAFGQILLKPLVLDVNYQHLVEGRDSHRGNHDKYNYQWTTKAKEWEYEKEVRLIMSKPSARYFALTPEQTKQSDKTFDWREIHCYIPLRGECFESIYFGVNVDQNERERIIEYARKVLNPQIRLFQMRVDDTVFKLKPEAL